MRFDEAGGGLGPLDHPEHGWGGNMTTKKSIALKLCGFLYIFILITNAASVGLGDKTGETDSAAMLVTISENPGRYRMGVVVAVASHLGIMAIAGTLFVAFSPLNRPLAVIGSVSRLGEALAMIYGEFTVLGLIDLARDYASAYSNKESLLLLGGQILQIKNTGVDWGLLLLSVGVIAYGISFVRSRAVPSKIAWLGLAAGIISAIGISIKFASGFSALAVIGMVLMMVFEVTFGGWLLFFSHANSQEGLV
jgi:hypothetical protein